MTPKPICPCCEINRAEHTCAKCGRHVCSQCIQPKGSETSPVCYCGASCAQYEREWHAKKLKKEKV